MRADFRAAMDACERDDSLRAVIITGSGRRSAPVSIFRLGKSRARPFSTGATMPRTATRRGQTYSSRVGVTLTVATVCSLQPRPVFVRARPCFASGRALTSPRPSRAAQRGKRKRCHTLFRANYGCRASHLGGEQVAYLGAGTTPAACAALSNIVPGSRARDRVPVCGWKN
jgi:hypothetical protein